MAPPTEVSTRAQAQVAHLGHRLTRSLATVGMLRLGPRLARLHWQLGIPPDYPARGLPRYAEARDVVRITENHFATPDTVLQFRAMQGVAARHGVTLVVDEAYRGYDRQANVMRGWLRQGVSIEDILTRETAPGYSEHHSGRAIDIGCPGYLPVTSDFAQTSAFANSPAYAWLSEYAPRFGFAETYRRDNAHGLMYEPWHWALRP